MIFEKKIPAFSDERGSITDIIEDKLVDHITVITSEKGAIRGNHFHKESIQYLYLVEGKIKAFSIDENGFNESEIITSGTLIINPPHEVHAFIALERSVFFVFTRGPRGGKAYESDTYRVKDITQSV